MSLEIETHIENLLTLKLREGKRGENKSVSKKKKAKREGGRKEDTYGAKRHQKKFSELGYASFPLGIICRRAHMHTI